MVGEKKVEIDFSLWYQPQFQIYAIPFNHQIRREEKKKIHIFTVREIKQWNNLPREAVESWSSEIFKIRFDTDLSNLL